MKNDKALKKSKTNILSTIDLQTKLWPVIDGTLNSNEGKVELTMKDLCK